MVLTWEINTMSELRQIAYASSPTLRTLNLRTWNLRTLLNCALVFAHMVFAHRICAEFKVRSYYITYEYN